jgi:hypothetical protein
VFVAEDENIVRVTSYETGTIQFVMTDEHEVLFCAGSYIS